MSIARRVFAAGIAATAGLALLNGCGGSDADDAAAPGASTAAVASFPVSLTHKLGTAEIKAAPQRIVALSDADLDALLMLGVQPVGVAESSGPDGITEWAKPLLTSKPTVLTAGDTG